MVQPWFRRFIRAVEPASPRFHPCHIGFYDVARSQNSVAGLSQKPPRSRFLPPPQAFLAHFARFVPILCAVKQIQEAQSANRNHIPLL